MFSSYLFCLLFAAGQVTYTVRPLIAENSCLLLMEMAMGAIRVKKNIKVVDKKTKSNGLKDVTLLCSRVEAMQIWMIVLCGYKQFPLTQ